jgi:transcriptional regulator with XRE-family HTH domain
MTYPNIAAECARNGISQTALADRLGVTRKTVYNWMKAGKIPQKKLAMMSKLFGVSADYLLGRTDTPTT